MLPTFSIAMNLGETAFYADLKGCYFVGMSLCRQCESSTFGMRAATLTPYVCVYACIHMYACHVFPQSVLAVITPIGV